jgi:hypothetical protein
MLAFSKNAKEKKKKYKKGTKYNMVPVDRTLEKELK